MFSGEKDEENALAIQDKNDKDRNNSDLQRKRRTESTAAYSFWSSSISSFFWHPVVGLAILNCNNNTKTNNQTHRELHNEQSKKRDLTNASACLGKYLHLGSKTRRAPRSKRGRRAQAAFSKRLRR